MASAADDSMPSPGGEPARRARGRGALVRTHMRCSQACRHCTLRSATDDPRAIRAAAVLTRVDTALAEGATHIVFSGGEPTLRADLPALLRATVARGALTVGLETNATSVDAGMARALYDAGLRTVRVHLPGLDTAYDEFTRDPGGYARALAGVRALLGAGLELELAFPLVRSTRSSASDLLEGLPTDVREAVRTVYVVLPSRALDPEESLSPREAESSLATLAAASTRTTIPVRLAPETAPPPCLFEAVSTFATLVPSAHRHPEAARIDACARCTLASRCDGLPPDRAHLAHDARPIVDDKLRRRLTLITSVEAQIAREFLSRDTYSDLDGHAVEEDTIRVNFHCNQACSFCFVSTHLPPPEAVTVRAAIEDAGRAGRRITLSGGEPTLNPALVDFVALASRVSAHPVRIQTNAVRLGEPGRVESLVRAGLAEAFVSLHGATAGVCDAVTRAPGTFDKTLAGLDALHAAGVAVIVNFVLCGRNAHELPACVRLVHTRWPRASLNVSFVAPSTDLVPRTLDLVPRYGDVLPHVAAAISLGEALGVAVVGFESMCGVPLCLVPDAMRRFDRLLAVPAGADRGEFAKPPPCHGCALSDRCYGVRVGYLELHGDGDLRPVVHADVPRCEDPATDG